MKTLSIALILATLTSNSAFSSCLDRIPGTEEELKYEIKMAQVEYKNALEIEDIYKEIAHSAESRKNLATGVLIVTTAPVTYLGGLALFSLKLISDINLALAVGTVAGTAITATEAGLYVYDLSNGVRDLPAFIEKKAGQCSYKEMQSQLADQREQILENDFDGSIKNQIKERFTLGRVSSDATAKLYGISQMQTFLAESKLRELQDL